MLGIAPLGGYHMPPGVFHLEHDVLFLDEDTLNRARKNSYVTTFHLVWYTWRLDDEFVVRLSYRLGGIRL